MQEKRNKWKHADDHWLGQSLTSLLQQKTKKKDMFLKC